MIIKIGADPEVFARSRQTGQIVSAHNMIRGTKEKPMPVEFGGLQVDGTALEFNIDPANSCDEFINHIARVRAQMAEAVERFDVDIVAEPVAEFDLEYFNRLPRRAVELGCNPDYNAWTMEVNPPPEGDRTFRTGAGHIHIGWGEGFEANSEEHFFACVPLIRQLDYYIGLATLLWDTDNRRRSLYGCAGAFRPKSYGAEYRVPSNVWLRDERTQRFVYNAAIKAVTDLMAGDDKGAQFGDKARELIDNNVTDWYESHDFGTGLDIEEFKRYAG